jgi:hypothetical protein
MVVLLARGIEAARASTTSASFCTSPIEEVKSSTNLSSSRIGRLSIV